MKTAILDSLKTDADLILGDLAKDHDPVLITDDGRPAAYLIDAADYEAQQDRLRILEGIARGEQALASGLVFSHADAKARMARWLSPRLPN
ncbi:MAG: prevent-host-death family protein [Rhodothermales bacterium]|jgi:prevent-host-death family protein